MSDQFAKMRSIFLDALDRDGMDAQLEYAENQCAEQPQLRETILRMLKAHHQTGGVLASSVDATQSMADEGDITGTEIGPYKIRELLGEGGMGSVYVAEQEKPVRRKVALKVVRAGMDSRQVIARFEAERQVLALMDHPNIAKVLDAGTSETGRPYFVMELVRGVPITEFCDSRKLTTRERLELFIKVCRAVQHAHQKGIIHRDIKPSNVLVTLHDDVAVPKVIDFGIAKATSQTLTDNSLYTGFNQLLGTPLYMSPEQAEMNALDVDTRSDVYSLGVLFYELLTGTTPFDGDTLKRLGFDEMRRMIRDVDPPRPSERVSTLNAEARSTVSQRRGVDVIKLNRLLRGELDWIVMKSLEKDRTRRYESASSFADDVRRYLKDQPVQACPPSVGYRFRKFAGRNKVAILTGSLVFVALLISSVVSLWQANAASIAKQEADQHRERAESNLVLAQKAVENALKKLAAEPRLKEAELAELRRDLLEGALPFYAEFARQRSEDPEVEAGRAEIFRQLSILHREMKEYETALADAEQCREIFARLGSADPAEPSWQLGLAKSHVNRGALLDDTGDAAGAATAFQVVIKILGPVADEPEDFPEHGKTLATAHHNLAVVLLKQNQVHQAEKEAQTAIATLQSLVSKFPASPEYRADLGRSRDKLGQILSMRGQVPEAESELIAALEVRKSLAIEFPNELDYRKGPVASHQNLGVLYSITGDLRRSEAETRAGLALQSSLVTDFPHIQGLRSGMTDLHLNLVGMLRMQGKLTEAEVQYRALAEFQKSQIAEYPHVPELRQKLLDSQKELSRILSQQLKFEESETELLAAVIIAEQLIERFPKHSNQGIYRLALANTQRMRGEVFMEWGKVSEARGALDQSHVLCQQLVTDFPGVPEYRRELVQVLIVQGLVAGDEENLSEQMTLFENAQQQLEQLANQHPESQEILTDLGGNLCNIGQNHSKNKKHEEALKAFERAEEVFTSVLKENADNQAARRFLANTCFSRADTLGHLGRWADAFKSVEEVLKLSENTQMSPLFKYESAGLYAKASIHEPDTEKREAIVLHAIEFLREARAAGHFAATAEIEELKTDSDLEPIRSRPEYLEFVRELTE